MAAKEVASDILIHGSLEQVWSVVVDFDAYADWNPFMPKVRAQAEIGSALHATSRLPSGIRMRFVGTITVVDRPNRLAWRAKPALLPASLLEVEHVITLTDHDFGEVHVHQLERATGRLVPFSGWLFKQAQLGQEEMNRALEDRVEQA